MLSSDCAEIKIAERPHLSKKALLSLASLLSLPDPEGHVHDNLLQTVVDGCKGGERAATTTSGSEDPNVAVPIDAKAQTEIIDLMARILMVVFQAEGGTVDARDTVPSQD
jgi:hypothetical protein